MQRILRRASLGRRRERLALLEHHSAETCGLTTERAGGSQPARVAATSATSQADVPGELVWLDTFFLSGSSRAWARSGDDRCDAGLCSYGRGLTPSGALG